MVGWEGRFFKESSQVRRRLVHFIFISGQTLGPCLYGMANYQGFKKGSAIVTWTVISIFFNYPWTQIWPHRSYLSIICCTTKPQCEYLKPYYLLCKLVICQFGPPWKLLAPCFVYFSVKFSTIDEAKFVRNCGL